MERGAEGRRALAPTRSTKLIVTGMHARAVRGIAAAARRAEGGARRRPRAPPSATPAPRTPRCCSPTRSSRRSPARSIALVCSPTASTCSLFRTTDAIASYTPARTVATQDRATARRSRYGKFLSWRGTRHARAAPPARARPHLGVGVGPHRGVEVRVRRLARPHERRAAPAAGARLARRRRGRRHGRGADGRGRRARSRSFTIDRIAYSPSPPITFAVVDFDGGGRLPVELDRRRRRHARRSATGSR